MTCPNPELIWPECIAPATTIAPTTVPVPPPTTEVQVPPPTSVATPTTEPESIYPFEVDVCLNGERVTLTITSPSDAQNAYLSGATEWPCQYPPDSPPLVPADGVIITPSVDAPNAECYDPVQQGFCATTVVGAATSLPVTGPVIDGIVPVALAFVIAGGMVLATTHLPAWLKRRLP